MAMASSTSALNPDPERELLIIPEDVELTGTEPEVFTVPEFVVKAYMETQEQL